MRNILRFAFGISSLIIMSFAHANDNYTKTFNTVRPRSSSDPHINLHDYNSIDFCLKNEYVKKLLGTSYFVDYTYNQKVNKLIVTFKYLDSTIYFVEKGSIDYTGPTLVDVYYHLKELPESFTNTQIQTVDFEYHIFHTLSCPQKPNFITEEALLVSLILPGRSDTDTPFDCYIFAN